MHVQNRVKALLLHASVNARKQAVKWVKYIDFSKVAVHACIARTTRSVCGINNTCRHSAFGSTTMTTNALTLPWQHHGNITETPLGPAREYTHHT